MTTISFDKKQVKMVAHRGLSGLECENSCAAFVAAGNHSYYGIETDVHVTRDGKYILIHDDHTGRVSDTDIPVEDSTYEELCQVRLYGNVGEKAPGRRDLVLPALSDYIRICKHYDKVAVLELKNRIAPAHIAGIVEEIRELGYLEKTTFISFYWENLLDLRRLLPEQPLQYLVGFDLVWTDELAENLKKYRIGLDAHFSFITPDRVELLHSMGVEVNCWTVDTAELGEKLAAMGVDYITTNILE
ncbi:MAG: hypothetical protein J6L24_02870 [Oscillospiraceae bacterium]|nr:hypothetical protein [Clostridia bacterium]MBP3304890.1 hypothetical protein [Oscillospiraceae bacterium]